MLMLLVHEHTLSNKKVSTLTVPISRTKKLKFSKEILVCRMPNTFTLSLMLLKVSQWPDGILVGIGLKD